MVLDIKKLDTLAQLLNYKPLKALVKHSHEQHAPLTPATPLQPTATHHTQNPTSHTTTVEDARPRLEGCRRLHQQSQHRTQLRKRCRRCRKRCMAKTPRLQIQLQRAQRWQAGTPDALGACAQLP